MKKIIKTIFSISLISSPKEVEAGKLVEEKLAEAKDSIEKMDSTKIDTKEIDVAEKDAMETEVEEITADEIEAKEVEAEEIEVEEGTDFKKIFDQSVRILYTARPASSTMAGLDEALVDGKYSDKLDDYSPMADAKLRTALRALNSSLEDETAKSDQAEENRLVMMNLNEYYSGNKNFDIGYIDTWMGLSPFIVSQINGPLIDIPSMLTTSHAINDRQGVDDFIARLNQYDVFAA